MDRDIEDFKQESDEKIQDVLNQAKIKLGEAFRDPFHRGKYARCLDVNIGRGKKSKRILDIYFPIYLGSVLLGWGIIFLG